MPPFGLGGRAERKDYKELLEDSLAAAAAAARLGRWFRVQLWIWQCSVWARAQKYEASARRRIEGPMHSGNSLAYPEARFPNSCGRTQAWRPPMRTRAREARARQLALEVEVEAVRSTRSPRAEH